MTVQVALKSFLLICLLVPFAVGGGNYLAAQSKPNRSPREALLIAMRAQLNARSYRMREVQFSTGEGAGFSTITMWKYLAPDKYHAAVETPGAGVKGELILLGGVGFAKAVDGQWQRKQFEPGRIELEVARLRNSQLIDDLTKAREADVKLAGQVELDGSTMLIYQYSYAGPREEVTRYPAEVWVGVRDGLPHRIEVGWGANQKGLQFSFKTTTSYFDYNADVTIEAPM